MVRWKRRAIHNTTNKEKYDRVVLASKMLTIRGDDNAESRDHNPPVSDHTSDTANTMLRVLSNQTTK